MAKRRLAESEVQKILLEYNEGMSVNQLVEKYGISRATMYNWISKYGYLSLNEISRLKQLNKDHERLKKMFAELSLENLALKAQLKKLDHH